jgi:Cytochrome bd terminal oxidase subunit II
MRLGIQNELGWIVVASRRTDFPNETERLLLSVATNQTAIGLQEARLLSEQKRIASELEETVAQQTRELQDLKDQLQRENVVLREQVDEASMFEEIVGTAPVLQSVLSRVASFSGCYLALFLILWCVLLRGISIEVGGHLSDRLWQEFWDSVFVFSNVLLAVLFGAALGNVARGVPLTAEGTFYLPFFTNFNIYGNVGLLDWYTVPMALFCVLILTMKTEGAVHERSVELTRSLWLAVIPAFFLITLLT